MRKPAEFRRMMLDQKMEFEAMDARHIAAAVRESAALPHPPPTQEIVTQVPPPVPAPVVPTPEEKLRSLAKLRDDGLLTPEEFEAKKAELIDQL